MEKQLAEVVDGTEIKEITETQNLCSCENDGASNMCSSENDDTHRSSSDSTALSLSGAVVRVFVGSEQIGEYHVPTDQVGTYWTVFQISGSGRVVPINSISNIKPDA